MADIDSKRCTKCGATKLILEFPLCKGRPRARCKPCHSSDAMAWAEKNREKYAARLKAWKRKNRPPRLFGPPAPPEIVARRTRETRKAWGAKNRDKDTAYKKKWSENNPHILAEVCRRRQVSQRCATPSWADRKAMQRVYRQAREMSAATGVRHVVDHIVPVVSRLVCGLHCPANLQVLPETDNIAKGNRWWPDMP